MARRQYLCHDLDGHAWAVRTGDPAYSFMERLHAAGETKPVLPISCLMVGWSPAAVLESIERRVVRLGNSARRMPDDTDVQAAFVLACRGLDCLKALVKVQLTGSKE